MLRSAISSVLPQTDSPSTVAELRAQLSTAGAYFVTGGHPSRPPVQRGVPCEDSLHDVISVMLRPCTIYTRGQNHRARWESFFKSRANSRRHTQPHGAGTMDSPPGAPTWSTKGLEVPRKLTYALAVKIPHPITTREYERMPRDKAEGQAERHNGASTPTHCARASPRRS